MAKTVFITGVSRGIGLALAEKFLRENYTVIGASRTPPPCLVYRNFTFLPLNLAEKREIEEVTDELSGRHCKIDILINNAGIGPDLDRLYPDPASMQETFEINVFGLVSLTEKIIPLLNQEAKIINISSDMGSLTSCSSPDSAAYRMSKAALNMYTKVLANRYRSVFKIASLHPGWVRTTIAPSSVHGRLSPEESADKIFAFITSGFESGAFWNIEKDEKSEW